MLMNKLKGGRQARQKICKVARLQGCKVVIKSTNLVSFAGIVIYPISHCSSKALSPLGAIEYSLSSSAVCSSAYAMENVTCIDCDYQMQHNHKT